MHQPKQPVPELKWWMQQQCTYFSCSSLSHKLTHKDSDSRPHLHKQSRKHMWDIFIDSELMERDGKIKKTNACKSVPAIWQNVSKQKVVEIHGVQDKHTSRSMSTHFYWEEPEEQSPWTCFLLDYCKTWCIIISFAHLSKRSCYI